MPNATNQDNWRHAVDLVFFEQWLRFYFIVEEEGKLFIRLPRHELETARELYPRLYPVANALNNCEINHQTAMDALCENLMSGPYAMTGQEWADVLAGQDFRMTLQLMSFWVQAEEEKLDSEPATFREWKERFLGWCETPVVKDYTARVMSGDEIASSRMQ